MKKSATALQIGIDKHGHLRRRPITAGLVAWFPGGAVAYTQITRTNIRDKTSAIWAPKSAEMFAILSPLWTGYAKYTTGWSETGLQPHGKGITRRWPI